MDEAPQRMDRREFLKLAGAQTGLLVAGAAAADARPAAASAARLSGAPAPGGRRSEVVVVGAGAFGGWTAFHLQRLGHPVTLVDAYGPGNSRSTSGDETRGIRTGYGQRELWTRWAAQSIERWKEWDREWGTQLFTTTGDLILREEMEPFLSDTMETWNRVGVAYEVLSHDEIAYRYPQIRLDGIEVGLYERDAGVGRSRAACLAVAEKFQQMGGKIVMAKAAMGGRTGDRLDDLVLAPGERLGGQIFVFALGPWFPKAFPELMADKIRIPLGHVFYFGTPPGDNRFTTPNLPSYNFPGVTGWPSLHHDARGFRVRTGGRPPEDPDVSVRWIDPSYHASARTLLEERFPALADAPLVETRACHYESSVSRNFILDRHPGLSNVWIAGGGSAEGFKFGPTVGEYLANRITGASDDPELAAAFRFPGADFQAGVNW
jgi:sarcosine oxidase